MANTLTGLIPVIYEALDVVSREQVGMVKNVAKDVDASQVAKGQTIRSPIVGEYDATDITPGVTAPDEGNQAVDYVDITISKERSVKVRWNGNEDLSTARKREIKVNQFVQAFRNISNEVSADLTLTAKKGASRAVGTAGTTPFATAGDFSDFATVNQVLDDNGAPAIDRFLDLSSAALANIRGKQSVLFKANEAGTDDLLRRGIIGQVQGLNLSQSASHALHTKGTGTGYLANADEPVGENGIAVDTGTGTVLAGDVVTFAGDGNKYVVNTGGTDVTLVTLNKPGLLVALDEDDAMTIGNSYTPNIAWSRDAIQLATRLPAMPDGGDMADDVMNVYDEVSGITFQIAVYKQYRQVMIEVGLAWGQTVVKPEHVVTLMG